LTETLPKFGALEFLKTRFHTSEERRFKKLPLFAMTLAKSEAGFGSRALEHWPRGTLWWKSINGVGHVFMGLPSYFWGFFAHFYYSLRTSKFSRTFLLLSTYL